MSKTERQAHWMRRKGKGNPRHCPRGWECGNPRYRGDTDMADTRTHKMRATMKTLDTQQRIEA